MIACRDSHLKKSRLSTVDGLVWFGFMAYQPFHGRLTLKLSRCLEEVNILKWMTKEKTTLFQKDPPKKILQQLD